MSPRVCFILLVTLMTVSFVASSPAAGQPEPWAEKIQPELRRLMAGGPPPPTVTAPLVPATPEKVQHRVLITLARPATLLPSVMDYRSLSGLNIIQNEVAQTQERVLSRDLAGSYRTLTRYNSLFGYSALADAAAIEAMARLPEVERVEIMPIYYKTSAESHPLAHVDAVHALGFTGEGVTIAIIDDGIDHDHPAFGGFAAFPNAKILGGRDFADNDDDPTIDCTAQSHGTAVAGVAAGNGGGVTGTAPDASFVMLKVQSAMLCGEPALDGDIVGAIDWAVTNREAFGIRVISMSLGGGGFGDVASCESSSTATRDAVDAAVAAGLVVLAASGNDGFCSQISRPACVGSAISVGAVYDAPIGSPGFCVSSGSCDSQLNSSCTSSFRACFDANNTADEVTCYSNSAPFLDILAPSHCAFTALAGGGINDCFGGTSSATPFAAGVAAALIEADGSLDNEGMRALLSAEGVPILDAKSNVSTPRVDAQAALEALPNTPPAVSITAPAAGDGFTAGDSIVFAGTAADAQDGDLSAGLAWTSDLDGAVGSGASFSSSSLSSGAHVITAAVTDSGGLSGQDSVSITVGGVPVIDWNITATVPYSDQDGSGSISVADDGATFLLEGDRWRRTAETFDVTPFTVLEFDYRSTSQGEIHGIGFDQDDDLFDAPRIFQLFGTQSWNGALHAYDDVYSLGATVSYRIPVGAFYTGTGFRLVLVNDKDAGAPTNTGRFSNVRVFESPPDAAPLDFNAVGTEAYSNQDGSGSRTAEDSGASLLLQGNTWRRTTQSFTITPTTVVSFDFQSTSQGEIHGLGFDENQTLSDEDRIFRLFGTQSWSGDIDWFREYEAGEVGTLKSYVIPVGRFYTGSGFRLVLVNDKDAGAPDNTSRFRNVRVYELR